MDPFSYVLGVCLSDASLTIYHAPDTRKYRKPRAPATIAKHWIQMEVKDESFARRFTDAIAAIRGRPVRYYPTSRTNFSSSTVPIRKDYEWRGWLVSLTYKALWLRLKPARDAIRAGTYDWPSEVVPEDVLLGVIDGDGSVHATGRIIIGTIYPSAIQDICRRAGIASRSYMYHHQTVPVVTIKKSLAARFDTIKRRTQCS